MGKSVSFLLEHMDCKLQETFDRVIQKFWLPTYVKKAHKEPKKIGFDDGSIFPWSYFIQRLGLTPCFFVIFVAFTSSEVSHQVIKIWIYKNKKVCVCDRHYLSMFMVRQSFYDCLSVCQINLSVYLSCNDICCYCNCRSPLWGVLSVI